MGLALAQHLGQIPLGVSIQHEDFLSVQRKTSPQVIDRRAFANSALLICYTYHLGFRQVVSRVMRKIVCRLWRIKSVSNRGII